MCENIWAKYLMTVLSPSSASNPQLDFFFCQMDVWPEVNIVKEYTGFELEVEEPPIDEPR